MVKQACRALVYWSRAQKRKESMLLFQLSFDELILVLLLSAVLLSLAHELIHDSDGHRAASFARLKESHPTRPEQHSSSITVSIQLAGSHTESHL